MVKKKSHKDLKLTDERLYFKPFKYPWAYEAWLAHEQSHWLHTECPMLEDVKDWKNRLNDHERRFLTNIFRFFTQGDIDVAGGYVKNYLPYFAQPEVRMMLLGFAAREALHIAAYSHLIESLGMPATTYNEFLQYAEMKEKHDYLLELSSKNGTKESTAAHIAAFSAFTEGMQLFSSFIMLLNFPRHGVMRGMGQIVTWSIVDETQHTENMIKLFRTYIEENKEIWNDDLKSRIYTIATKMVDLEDKFIDLAFGLAPMADLDARDVKSYIRYIADRRLISLGLKGIMKVKKNPLPWVEEMINSPIHTNFFENRATDYAKGALSGSWGDVWANAA
ncbi:MAG: ribonucleotide-diphosphate reductase subunit beta [Actinobacteria bacterium]|nr:ribonucleotide-diphosphate reductase subunit beta [Actinomycetota bacterium]NDE81522.1 ribonucleotide-diphosphate reductase subunit beta [Actinomycetota bacterium]